MRSVIGRFPPVTWNTSAPETVAPGLTVIGLSRLWFDPP